MPRICLIAEHDPWMIQLLRLYVERMGLEGVPASVGQRVLPLAVEYHPSVILLEGDLPGTMRSPEVITGLREHPDTCRIPVIVFTWLDRAATPGLCIGADSYVQKPVSYHAFLQAFEEVGLRRG